MGRSASAARRRGAQGLDRHVEKGGAETAPRLGPVRGADSEAPAGREARPDDSRDRVDRRGTRRRRRRPRIRRLVPLHRERRLPELRRRPHGGREAQALGAALRAAGMPGLPSDPLRICLQPVQRVEFQHADPHLRTRDERSHESLPGDPLRAWDLLDLQGPDARMAARRSRRRADARGRRSPGRRLQGQLESGAPEVGDAAPAVAVQRLRPPTRAASAASARRRAAS